MGFESLDKLEKERIRIHRVGWNRLWAAAAMGLTGLGFIAFASSFFWSVLGLFWLTGIPVVAIFGATLTGVWAINKAVNLLSSGLACLRFV